jgi:chromosome condensin MukBEF complex kleisin-like MukF subunit
MWPFGRMIMCHMFADTNEELEAMARKLGLRESWRQKPRASIGPHYDIATSKRNQAIRLGAVACDTIEAEVAAFDRVEESRRPKEGT